MKDVPEISEEEKKIIPDKILSDIETQPEEKSVNTDSEKDSNTEPEENAGKSDSETVSETKLEEKTVENESKSEDDGNYKWYAVRIISGHEKKIKTYLDNEIALENLSHKIKNVLLPLEKVFEVKSGKKKVKLKNFLPGYILIEAVLDDEVRNFISRSPSIINMVGTKNIKAGRLEPIPLRDNEVKRIKSILNEESQSEKIDFKLSVGDPVKVTSGPFNNFNGNVLEINMEKMKVKVMVSIFGRKTPIELEFTQVEREK
ncbi:MAG: transcription termination/antitermination factor NusG [Ignavibacteria bacterium]|nr:transcription termination/antitermination factor NusG [Ignavibacteria bacterium]